MELIGIDHLVLVVEDVDETCEFYSRAIGTEVRAFGDGRTALHVGDQKVNLHAVDDLEPDGSGPLVAANPTPGSGDFCLLVDSSIEAVEERLAGAGVDVIEGPVERVGARGRMTSVYVRDPDGNLIEVATYEGNAP